MKKALIAIISVIYVVAIIIVSFLGIRAEVVNETIYVQEIVLLNQTLYYPNMPKIEDNAIVSVYKRPSEDAIGDDGVGEVDGRLINWDFNGVSRDYAIFIDDYFYLYENMGKKYTIETSVKPEDATKKDLTYYMSGSDAVKEKLSLTNYGEITFSLQHKGWVDVDILISSTDMSGVEIDILLKIGSYL